MAIIAMVTATGRNAHFVKVAGTQDCSARYKVDMWYTGNEIHVIESRLVCHHAALMMMIMMMVVKVGPT
jgi:hypothetical protein